MMSVTFHGGALLTNVEAQAVYLGNNWASSANNSQTTQLDTFNSYLVQSPYMDMLTNAGYNVGRGTATAGVVDNVALSGTISDATIQSDLNAMINSGQVAAPDANRLYIVYAEPGVVVSLGRGSTSKNSFLGYHGAFQGSKGEDVRYAVIPYPGSPNPSSGSQGFASVLDELTAVTSHEVAEAVTDPDVNYKQIGWYDDNLNGEIADLTGQTTRLNGYLVQDVVGRNDNVIAPSTVAVTPVTAPTNVTATPLTSTTASVTWTAVPSAVGYRIYLVNGTQNTLLGSVGPGTTTATVAGLAAGATSSLVVEAYNSLGKADSSPVSVTTPQAPALAAPQGVTAIAASNTSATISWNLSAGATGYRIYETGGASPVLVGTGGAHTTSVTVNGLVAGSTDTFYVEAFNAAASVADSSVASVTLPTTSTLTAPTVTATALNANNAQITWNAVSGAQGYNIYVMIGNTPTLLGSVSGSSTGVIVTGMTGGQTYQFMIEAFSGSTIADSAWASVTTPTSTGRGHHGWH